MMQHYAIDALNEHSTTPIAGTNRPVVNPIWRGLDRQARSLKTKLTRLRARFAELTLHPPSDNSAKDRKRKERWTIQKAELLEEIEQFEHDLDAIKSELKSTEKHLEWGDLPDDDKFERLSPSRKRLIDTVKLIAYRAETAMTAILREKLARRDDGRSLVCDLFRTEADLEPNLDSNELRVHIHGMSNARSNQAIAHLLEHLNATEFCYPGTQLKLIYTIDHRPEISEKEPKQIHGDQEP